MPQSRRSKSQRKRKRQRKKTRKSCKKAAEPYCGRSAPKEGSSAENMPSTVFC